MLDTKKFEQLKAAADKAQRDADKAAGALEQTMATLKANYGCGTIKEAEALAAKLTQEAEEAELEFNKALAEFEEDWQDRIE